MTDPNQEPQVNIAVESQNPLARAGEALQNFAGRIGTGLRNGYETVLNAPRSLRVVEMLGVSAVASFALAHSEATAEPVSAEATISSHSNMTPNDVMAKMGQTISFVAKQKPEFTMIRPKTARMAGRTYYFWGGKDTCRPGHDNDPEQYFIGDTGNKYTGGNCTVNGPTPPGSLAHHPNEPGLYTKNMNKVAATLEARDGLNLPHGNTTSIKATNTKAKFNFKNDGNPKDIKSLKINAKGRIVNITTYK